jgi:tetratricopeptide (TPR) repeat protein
MAAYYRYVRRPAVRTYLPVVGSLVLGLLAKPMLVTLPFVLLLLDYWPLGRMHERRAVGRLAAEKLPLMAVAAVSALITLHVQTEGGAVMTVDRVPLSDRLANAVLSYAVYVQQLVWPVGLAPFYPYVSYSPVDGRVVAAGAGLVLATAACLRWGRSLPYLAVGWLWFLGTLVPVIGLVQVGLQAHADRYTYVPCVGLLILAVWGAADLLTRWRVSVPRQRGLAGAVVVGYAVLTWIQIGYWRNNAFLWAHTLDVTSPDNFMAQQNLGLALSRDGRPQEALPHLVTGARLDPHRTLPQIALALCLVQLGRDEEAIEPLVVANRINPNDTQVREFLGRLLAKAGREEEALPHLLAADPDDPAGVQLKLGMALLGQRLVARARARLEEAVVLAPDRAEAQAQLGLALAMEGRPADAERPLREAVRLDPANAQSRGLLGLVQAHRGDLLGALGHCRAAVAINPKSATARGDLAMVLTALGQVAEAQREYATAARLDRTWGPNAVLFAWDAAVRRPGLVGLFLARCQARQACEATGYRHPRALLALAAVEAADHRFGEAAELASRARAEAERAGDQRLTREVDFYCQSYRQNQPVLQRDLP